MISRPSLIMLLVVFLAVSALFIENLATAQPFDIQQNNYTSKGSISIGEFKKGSISPNEKHSYEFQINTKVMVSIDLKHDASNLDPYLTLQTEQGNIIQNDDDGGGALNSKIIAKLTPGRYKIIAGGLGTSSGAYELKLNTIDIKSISIGETIHDRVQDGRAKVYEFTLKSEGLVRIEGRRTDDSSFAPFIDLKSETGNPIASDLNNGACACSDLISYLNAGTYFIFFKGYNDSGGAYSLSITRKEYKAQEFTSIASGETKRGWIFPLQKHSYDFTMPKSGFVMIDLVKDNSNLDSFLWLYDNAGVEIASDDDGGGNLNSRLLKKLEAGSYKIVAGGLGNSSGKYALSVKAIESKNIGLNQTLHDSIGNNEAKIYLFTLNNQANISFAGKGTGEHPIRPYMDLLSINGQFIQKDNNTGTLYESHLSHTLSPGQYMLLFKDYGGKAGQYSLTLKEGAISTAQSTIEIGKMIRGNLGQNEKHSFNFQLKKDTYVSIDHMKGENSQLDAFLWLHDANGMQIQSDDDSGGNRNAKIMRQLKAGKYVVTAGTYSGSSGGYELFVREIILKDITPGQSMKDSLKSGEVKMYSFDVKKEGLYTVISKRVDGSNFAPYIDLKQESGKVIGNDFNTGSEPTSGISMYLPKGRYQILTKGHNNTSGKYQIMIRQEK